MGNILQSNDYNFSILTPIPNFKAVILNECQLNKKIFSVLYLCSDDNNSNPQSNQILMKSKWLDIKILPNALDTPYPCGMQPTPGPTLIVILPLYPKTVTLFQNLPVDIKQLYSTVEQWCYSWWICYDTLDIIINSHFATSWSSGLALPEYGLISQSKNLLKQNSSTHIHFCKTTNSWNIGCPIIGQSWYHLGFDILW